MRTGSFLAVGAATLASLMACSTERGLTLPDLRNGVSLSDPRVSPDGREIAVDVSAPDWSTDKSTHEIDLIDVASGARRLLTRYRKDVSSPRGPADGTRPWGGFAILKGFDDDEFMLSSS
ncbi:MAG TPA: hypothetical protein VIC29_00080 [Steroidobacteraceae bacterium]|jgi:hypothetical protein